MTTLITTPRGEGKRKITQQASVMQRGRKRKHEWEVEEERPVEELKESAEKNMGGVVEEREVRNVYIPICISTH